MRLRPTGAVIFLIFCFTSRALAMPNAKAVGKHVPQALKQIENANYTEIVEAYRAGESDRLRRAVNLFLKLFPESDSADDGLYWLARLSLDQGRVDEAGFVIEKLLKHYPGTNRLQSALVLKTVLFGKQGKWEEAEKAFDSAMQERKPIKKANR